MAGDFRGVDTPVLVPNTEVKDSIAEGSAGLACVRVGRRRPFFYSKRRSCAPRATAAIFFAREQRRFWWDGVAW